MLPKTIPILVSYTVKMELPSELTGQDRLAFFLLLLEKRKNLEKEGHYLFANTGIHLWKTGFLV